MISRAQEFRRSSKPEDRRTTRGIECERNAASRGSRNPSASGRGYMMMRGARKQEVI